MLKRLLIMITLLGLTSRVLAVQNPVSNSAGCITPFWAIRTSSSALYRFPITGRWMARMHLNELWARPGQIV